MHGILCEECNIFIRGNHKTMREHKKTQKHKQNHKKFILQKHIESKKNKKFSKLDFLKKKNKEESKKKEKKEIITKESLNSKIAEISKKEPISAIWRKRVDFSKNEIIYENLITGKKSKEIPFGIDPEEIPTIGIDSSIPHISNNWIDVKKNDNFFEKNKYEKNKKENFKKEKNNIKIENLWEKGGGDIKKAVFEFLENKNDFDCKFEKLEFLAKRNFELNVKEEEEGEKKEEKMKKKINHNLFRKRKIKKK